MGYIYLLLITTVIILIAPTLIKFLLIMWAISFVVSLFRPKKNTRTQYYQNTGQNTYSNDSYQQEPRRSNSDIIDVEFTQRDSQEN